jgi:hypothetical protein
VTPELDEFLGRIGAALDAIGAEWMIVGSVASSLAGAPRATQDVDVVVGLSAADLPALMNLLPDDQYYLDEEAARTAIRARRSFNVIDLRSGWKLDIMVAKPTPFARSELDRRVRVQVGGRPVWIATPEDVIIAKLAWSEAAGGSERQDRDVRGLLAARADLDRVYLRRWVDELGLLAAWNRVGG